MDLIKNCEACHSPYQLFTYKLGVTKDNYHLINLNVGHHTQTFRICLDCAKLPVPKLQKMFIKTEWRKKAKNMYNQFRHAQKRLKNPPANPKIDPNAEIYSVVKETVSRRAKILHEVVNTRLKHYDALEVVVHLNEVAKSQGMRNLYYIKAT